VTKASDFEAARLWQLLRRSSAQTEIEVEEEEAGHSSNEGHQPIQELESICRRLRIEFSDVE